MATTLRSNRHLGRPVWLGMSLVQFDEEGVAVGIIQESGGPPLPAPEPLTPEVLARAGTFPWFEIVEQPEKQPEEQAASESSKPIPPAKARKPRKSAASQRKQKGA
jgi:hypothetical protein